MAGLLLDPDLSCSSEFLEKGPAVAKADKLNLNRRIAASGSSAVLPKLESSLSDNKYYKSSESSSPPHSPSISVHVTNRELQNMVENLGISEEYDEDFEVEEHEPYEEANDKCSGNKKSTSQNYTRQHEHHSSCAPEVHPMVAILKGLPKKEDTPSAVSDEEQYQRPSLPSPQVHPMVAILKGLPQKQETPQHSLSSGVSEESEAVSNREQESVHLDETQAQTNKAKEIVKTPTRLKSAEMPSRLPEAGTRGKRSSVQEASASVKESENAKNDSNSTSESRTYDDRAHKTLQSSEIPSEHISRNQNQSKATLSNSERPPSSKPSASKHVTSSFFVVEATSPPTLSGQRNPSGRTQQNLTKRLQKSGQWKLGDRQFDEDDPYQVLMESLRVLNEIEGLIRVELGWPKAIPLEIDDPSIAAKIPRALLDALQNTMQVIIEARQVLQNQQREGSRTQPASPQSPAVASTSGYDRRATYSPPSTTSSVKSVPPPGGYLYQRMQRQAVEKQVADKEAAQAKANRSRDTRAHARDPPNAAWFAEMAARAAKEAARDSPREMAAADQDYITQLRSRREGAAAEHAEVIQRREASVQALVNRKVQATTQANFLLASQGRK